MKAVNLVEYDGSNRIALTADELAKQLGVGRRSAEKLGEEAGALIRIGKLKRYNIDKVMRYVTGED